MSQFTFPPAVYKHSPPCHFVLVNFLTFGNLMSKSDISLRSEFTTFSLLMRLNALSYVYLTFLFPILWNACPCLLPIFLLTPFFSILICGVVDWYSSYQSFIKCVYGKYSLHHLQHCDFTLIYMSFDEPKFLILMWVVLVIYQHVTNYFKT